MRKTESGFLLIVDISGYTSYLSKSELDHAQESLTALLTLLLEHTKPPLVVANLAGDAVFSYGLSGEFVQGQTFVEMIEETYVSFRRAVELMVLNTTCTCNACRNLGSLDLKFFLHYGEFGLQALAGRQELVGPDVILIHRLVKNHVVVKTGITAYTLYTEAALQHMNLEGFAAALVRHSEEYEHLGLVEVWLQDMHPVWDRKQAASRITLAGDDVLMAVHTDMRVPIEWVWDSLVQEEHFNFLAGGTHTEITGLTAGRLGEQAKYMCYHGDAVFPQTILEWEPFHRFVVQMLVPVPVESTVMLIEYLLESVGDSTRLTQTFGRATGPAEGVAMADPMMLDTLAIAQHDIDSFGSHVEAVAAQRRPAGPGTVVPPDGVAAAAAGTLRARAEQP